MTETPTFTLAVNQAEECAEMEQLYDALIVLTWDNHELANDILNACMGSAQ